MQQHHTHFSRAAIWMGAAFLMSGGCAVHPPARAVHEDICSRPLAVKEAAPAPLTPAQQHAAVRQYVAAIQAEIERHWFRPPTAVSGAQCAVHIKQRRDGCILDAAVTGCGADEHLRRSVEKAVYRASPLPMAPHPAVFDPDIVLRFRVP